MNPALLLLIIAVPLFASAMTVIIRSRVFTDAESADLVEVGTG